MIIQVSILSVAGLCPHVRIKALYSTCAVVQAPASKVINTYACAYLSQTTREEGEREREGDRIKSQAEP